MTNNIIYHDAQKICDSVNLDPLRESTILVTGSSGLIGTYILACLYHLCEQGVPIEVYGHHLSVLPTHVEDLIIRGGFKSLQANLANFDEYCRLPESDIIIHTAGYAQPSLYLADPVSTIQINTSATSALLKRLKRNGRLLFLSSAEVYCGLGELPFSETNIGTSTPLHPRAAYIEGKRCGETICNAFRSQGMCTTSVRLGDIYGPGTRKHDKRALNSFIEKALNHQKIELLDAGKAIRTYCYISDAVELLWEILLRGKANLYNLGGYSHISIAELANEIGKITETPVIFPESYCEITGAPEELHLDLSRIEKEFGKTKYVSLEDGLRATIEWQRALYANKV